MNKNEVYNTIELINIIRVDTIGIESTEKLTFNNAYLNYTGDFIIITEGGVNYVYNLHKVKGFKTIT
jgi:hypothetical protein